MSKLVIASNRGPSKEGVSSAGGLVAALSGLLRPNEFETIWISSSGMDGIDNSESRFHVKDEEYDFWLRPVNFSTIHMDNFYNNFSNGFLWPLMHLASHKLYETNPEFPKPKFDRADFMQYCSAQITFANTIIEETIKQGNLWNKDEVIIWNQDYHLMQASMRFKDVLNKFRLSSTCSERVSVGQFMHTPFFSIDIVKDLIKEQDPNGSRIPLEDTMETGLIRLALGMLSNDVIGFHTHRYAKNFSDTIEYLFRSDVGGKYDFSLPSYVKDIEFDGMNIIIKHKKGNTILKTEPIGVDTDHILKVVGNDQSLNYPLKEVNSNLEGSINEDKKSKKIVFGGLERCDYTKGLLSRVDLFAKTYNKLKDKGKESTFYQITAPSRLGNTDYQTLDELVKEKVSEVNPSTNNSIKHIDYGIPYPQNFRFMKEVDVMLVTPLEDGMNLVALEYILSQKYKDQDDRGLLVLGNCGSADYLKGLGFGPEDGVLIIPMDNLEEASRIISDSIVKGYHISENLVRHVESECKVQDWAGRCISSIQESKEMYSPK